MKLNYLFLIFASIVLLSACEPNSGEGVPRERSEEDREQPKEERQFLTPIVALGVERGEITATVAATASVVPIRSRLLETEEAGRLEFTQDWEEGQFVEQGTVIARMDSESLRGEIERAKADLQIQKENVDINQKSMESSIREYKILQDLYSKSIAALKDVDSAELSMQRAINTYRQGLINLEKSKASLAELEVRQERLDIRAPFAGLLVARNTLDGSKPFATAFGSESITDYEGRLVSQNFAVCGIIDTSQVLLRADVTAKDIERIRPGQDARATVYTTNDIEVSGQVVEIGKAVSEDTRAFRVDVLVDNPELTLKPGMFARMDIITERRRDTIAINKEYLVRRNNRDVVFVVDQNEDSELKVAREVAVELGLEGRDEIEVTWGLQEGDAIIIRGFEVLQDQTPISVLRADQPAVNEEESEDEDSNDEIDTDTAEADTTAEV